MLGVSGVILGLWLELLETMLVLTQSFRGHAGGLVPEKAERILARVWSRGECLLLERRQAKRVYVRDFTPSAQLRAGSGPSSDSGVTRTLCFPSCAAEGDHAEPIHLHHHPGDQHSVVAPGHQLRVHEHPRVLSQRRPAHRHRLR